MKLFQKKFRQSQLLITMFLQMLFSVALQRYNRVKLKVQK